MTKKEVLELKKRFTKDNASFDRICGCYVDADKNQVYKFNQKFLTMPEEDMFKYLDIAKKALSGKLENNLLELQFPREEEETGGRQQALTAILNSEMKSDDILDAFYQHVIDNYNTVDNYLILLFHDYYDVISRASDGSDGDSEDVYHYMIGAICPVNLSKSALGYSDNKIEAVKRNWIVGLPESAFLFPAFSDRSADIHSALFYTKNVKKPHTEFMTEILGCNEVSTAALKQEMLHDVVESCVDSENESDPEDAVLAYNQELSDMLEEHIIEGYQEDTLKMDKKTVWQAIESIGVKEEDAETIADGIVEMFGDDIPSVSSMIDQKLIKKNESRMQLLAMQEQIKRLMKENEELKKKLSEKE